MTGFNVVCPVNKQKSARTKERGRQPTRPLIQHFRDNFHLVIATDARAVLA
jgi:hypothetical protein